MSKEDHFLEVHELAMQLLERLPKTPPELRETTNKLLDQIEDALGYDPKPMYVGGYMHPAEMPRWRRKRRHSANHVG